MLPWHLGSYFFYILCTIKIYPCALICISLPWLTHATSEYFKSFLNKVICYTWLVTLCFAENVKVKSHTCPHVGTNSSANNNVSFMLRLEERCSSVHSSHKPTESYQPHPVCRTLFSRNSLGSSGGWWRVISSHMLLLYCLLCAVKALLVMSEYLKQKKPKTTSA